MPVNPTILKNCVRPRTQLLIGAVLVVLVFIWIVFVRRFIRSESLENIIRDRAVETSEGQFIGNDGARI